MNTKEEVIQLIKDLPDNVSTEEIMHELYVHFKFQQGALENMNEKPDTKTKKVKTKSGKWLH
ncbi:hypothetical protein J2Z83_003118 [Virgibacillus natechei]|uniref:DUF2281 domain-containing protein n=1 Tax=Virgibacillus natechei TaxID=1216297 RepID=A0ABS4IJ87_9BACI|nr:hypothetical protein [Virgibacillus natechei]MBP1970981.1 hypothetical protein [Virgibacillus natechei]UZD12749.1 hypothetical protein OLD84_17940 [Virgibacillus natechei]